MSRPFVHLHNHTEYSLLDGGNRIPEMVARTKELGMDSLAITDHGAMFGVMEFYWECEKKGIKPILGMEAYVAPNGYEKKSGREENETYHLLLLAKNLEGYRNLCRLATISALEGYYYKPRVDHELLRKYSAGIISTTTCIGSEVNQYLIAGDYEKANRTAGLYKEIFGEGNYFVELQDHGIPEQRVMKDGLLRISKELNLPLICTNDAHYLCKTDHQAHDVLLCIQTGNLVSDTDRLKFDYEEFYVKSPQEMAERFADTPEAVENTAMVAAMCDVQLGKLDANMPDPEVPEGETSRTWLRKLCEAQLPKRVRSCHDAAHERLSFELDVIAQTGFESYFLLVKEFAEFARDKGIYYGVRGSAAGSLVSYCLGITEVDPLEYDLTFERFLNPERLSMPDIDMDFEDARRDEVIKYVTERYGADHVAQIVTFGTLGAKAAVKDCGRALGYLPMETDRICKTIPGVPGMTLAKALKESAEFRKMYDDDPRVKTLVETAKNVEGIARHCGVHAAGIVISKEPLVEHIPLYRGNEGQAITAFEMGILEKIGLLKMDFLGLSNLTVLARALEEIKKTHPNAKPGEHPVLDGGIQAIPLDDPASYEILSRAETVGVFQLESSGMRRYIEQLKPQNINELAAMVALYRPGPMEHIPTFINTKFGRQQPNYLDERMKPILELTYGVIVYQDQVLKLVQALAGFSLGKADVLRRAMGKKDRKAMDSMFIEFESGAAERGIDKATCQKIWKLLEPFAGYAFNKAHAVCYAILAYQTAYLKANYPLEYLAASLSVFQGKEDRVVAFIEESRRLKISVFPPSVNESEMNFSVQGSAIRFGLSAIKGVGSGIAEAIIRERLESGPFKHLYEFAERLRPAGLNRTALDALIKSGALDCVEKNRGVSLEVMEGALVFADLRLKDRLAGQDSLFGGDSTPGGDARYPTLPTGDTLSRAQVLAYEKEVMGIYVTDHPLRGYERALQSEAAHRCSQIAELEDATEVTLAGVIASIRSSLVKATGKKMARVVLEDFSGQAQVVVFSKAFEQFQHVLTKDNVVKLRGFVSHNESKNGLGERTIEIRMADVSTLTAPIGTGETLSDSGAGLVVIRVHRATRSQLETLRGVIGEHPGDYEVEIVIQQEKDVVPIRLAATVEPSSAFHKAVKKAVAYSQIEVIEPYLLDFGGSSEARGDGPLAAVN